MKPLLFFFLIILSIVSLQFAYAGEDNSVDTEEESALRYSVSGHIKDAATGEELIGAAVIVKELGKGSVTNAYGFYSISLTPGFYQFTYSYVGYENQTRAINLNQDIVYNIELSEDILELEEVTISAEGPRAHVTKAEMGVNKLQIKTIKRIPTLLGEVDVIKAIQLLPGVQASSEGASGFSVRGGNPDQNLILLDEATVYNASHLMGFFSVFNNDAVKDVKLYKGDIPADYGGRLSSLLDVRMKDGNMKKFSGSGGIGTISSRLTFEGPIMKDRTSFLLAGRRTYADIFLPFAKEEDVRKSTMYFYDLNAKVNHIFNEKNRLFVSAYMGRDVFANVFAKMAFGNQTYTLRWNHLFSGKLFSNFTLVHSRYDYELGTPEGEANSFEWLSGMKDYAAKADMNYFITPEHTLKFGLISTFHDFKPGDARGLGEKALFTEFIMPSNYALENGIYLSAESELGERWNLKYGVRFSSFHNVGPSTVYNYDDNYAPIDSTVYQSGNFFNSYGGLEPRFAASFLLNDISSLKASYSRTRQYIHLAQNSTAGTPLDVWFPSSPNVNPQISDQVSVGYFRNFWNDRLEASVETYYKKMQNSIDFRDHAFLLMNKYMEGELRIGESNSYGLELLVRKNAGKLTGWVSYTLSKTERIVPEINNGQAYAAPYDKPHDLAIVLNYEITKRIWVSGNWVYSTGLPVTFPTGRFEYMGNIAPVYSNRNAYRMPDYHRLDMSVSLGAKDKPNRKWSWDLNLSVYNAYARKNAWTINFVQDEMNPSVTHAEMTYLFSIIPALTFNFHF
ncbi:carboxypeptidase-like regulatory domain-containing protein [Bacteroidota bacterium]